MKLKSVIFALCALFLVSNTFADKSFKKDQKEEIEGILHDYLLTNPEVLIEASRSLQEKQQQEMLARAQEAIPQNAKTLFESSTSPVIGNSKGRVYLVEFLDYGCGHCRKMYKIVKKLVANDKSLKVIVKEFPIFGGASDYAAKMALASNKQGKYDSFHSKLMTLKPPLTNDKVDKIAKSLKLDMKRLKRDADSDSVNKEMTSNLELAQKLGIIGTPAFVVAGNVKSKNMRSYFVPGSSSYDVLQSLIKKASGK